MYFLNSWIFVLGGFKKCATLMACLFLFETPLAALLPPYSFIKPSGKEANGQSLSFGEQRRVRALAFEGWSAKVVALFGEQLQALWEEAGRRYRAESPHPKRFAAFWSYR